MDTDSYVAVQLIERTGELSFESLAYMAEKLEGTYSFTVLSDTDELYFVKGNNPLCILHFPERGLYVYASTPEILHNALKRLPFDLGIPERAAIKSGELLRLDANGHQTRSTFDDSAIRRCSHPYAMGWYDLEPEEEYLSDLKAVAACCGLYPEDIDALIEDGADATFNEWCDYYLNLFPHAFHHAVRIYMTATSWDVLAPLAQAEREKYHDFSILLGPCRQREFRWYRFPASYDHVNLQFFDQLSEIQSRIKESKEEKWLVFVDNKTKGETFAKELGDKAAYIDVSRKGSETWNSLLAESRFEQQVLVTTSVLDCGVNIIDNKLHHVVVVTDSRTSLIQMLGRKRCRAGERVNLYVCDLSKQKIAERLQKCQELYSWYDRYKTSSDKERANMAREIWHSDDNRLRIFFHLGKEMFPNHLAFYGLSLKIKFYDTLTSGKLTFQEAVRGWLGRSTDDTMSATDKLLEFCEVHVDSELPTEEVDIFRQLVVAAAEEGGHKEPQPKRINFLGQEALNNRLQNIAVPYAIAKGSWTIIAK